MKYIKLVMLSMLFNMQVSANLTEREDILINHVRNSIDLAKRNNSKIDRPLNIAGATKPNVQHLLNNLCSLPNANYLEIGIQQGATFISALYKNTNLRRAVAIDNWSQQNVQHIFENNCRRLINGREFYFYEEDSFLIDVNKLFMEPVDIYFYDGCHTEESHEKAFTYYDSILAQSFITIIDDWNHSTVKPGTYTAFKKLGYTVLFDCELGQSGGPNCLWHNGIYVAVIRKSS